ncbi:hypothetical protein LSAT2_025383 [Lamellibrachia satsuma]|nr:hypothetical protein LSAT2_025383 [Lamellibrachia satsuma]
MEAGLGPIGQVRLTLSPVRYGLRSMAQYSNDWVRRNHPIVTLLATTEARRVSCGRHFDRNYPSDAEVTLNTHGCFNWAQFRVHSSIYVDIIVRLLLQF